MPELGGLKGEKATEKAHPFLSPFYVEFDFNELIL